MLLRRLFRFSTFTKYTKDHEWVTYDAKTNLAKIGITDYAQSELGDIVHIELPKIGLNFKIHQAIGAIESVKVAADVYAPLNGKVVSVNDELKDNPYLVNESAEKTWIVEAQVTDVKEFNELLDKQQYQDLLNKS